MEQRKWNRASSFGLGATKNRLVCNYPMKYRRFSNCRREPYFVYSSIDLTGFWSTNRFFGLLFAVMGFLKTVFGHAKCYPLSGPSKVTCSVLLINLYPLIAFLVQESDSIWIFISRRHTDQHATTRSGLILIEFVQCLLLSK